MIGGGLQHDAGACAIDRRRSSNLAEKRGFGRDFARAGLEQMQDEQHYDTDCSVEAEMVDGHIQRAADGAKGVHDTMRSGCRSEFEWCNSTLLESHSLATDGR